MISQAFDIEKGRTRGDGMEEQLDNPKQECSLATVAEGDSKPKQRRPSLHRKDSFLVEENIHARTAPINPAGCEVNSLTLPGLHTLYRRPATVSRSLPSVKPMGELVPLTPRLMTRANMQPDHKKAKPPKFVPCEPYPGAVNPIVPKGTGSGLPTSRAVQKIDRNNLDIAVLVSQMSSMRTQELDEDKEKKPAAEQAENEKALSLRNELKEVKEQRDYLQSQLKFQTNVNSELKNLLVASVGEDLQTRVNVLTEDKLQLAQALLHTANNLTTHTEQIEFLAGQCEVWRSKFLASSVMVEELARWKADLTQKNQMLIESSKRLLETTHQIREMQLEVLRNLKFLAKVRYLNVPAVDVVSLSAENLNIVQQMVLHSGVGMPENLNILSSNADPLCQAEKRVLEAMQFTSQPLMAPDEAIRALFGQVQRPYSTPSATEEVTAADSSTNVE